MAKVLVNGNEYANVTGVMLGNLLKAIECPNGEENPEDGVDILRVLVDGIEIPADSILQIHCGIKEIQIETEVEEVVEPSPELVVRIMVMNTTMKTLNGGKAKIFDALPTKKELRYATKVIDVDMNGEATVVWERDEA